MAPNGDHLFLGQLGETEPKVAQPCDSFTNSWLANSWLEHVFLALLRPEAAFGKSGLARGGGVGGWTHLGNHGDLGALLLLYMFPSTCVICGAIFIL